MKKIVLLTALLFVCGCFLYADTAVTITVQAYDNFDKISTMEAKYTIQTKQLRNGNIEKNVTNEFNISKNTTPGQVKTGLYPECLFNMKKYFENYNMTVKQKDERIKAGFEEVIAIPQGQTNQYPQVRLFIKGTKVKDIKFYNAQGKKYYTVKIKKYEKINGADFPTLIIEKMISEKTTIENTISYSNFK
jgi:hypothetical protein